MAVAIPAAARADPAQESRCTADNIELPEALQRIEWARRCGLLRNTGAAPGTGNPANTFDSGTLDTSLRWAKDYRENTADRSYAGPLYDYAVNTTYQLELYPGGAVTTLQETMGLTTGYWKWSQPTQRARPIYPTFETSPSAGSGTPLVPLPSIWGDCNLYQWNRATGTLTAWTGNFYVTAYCVSSCYAPDQSLRFSDGDVNVAAAMKAKRDDLVTLTADATLDDLATQVVQVRSYTTEIRDAENVIYKLTTASGGSLSVTNEHPILTHEGRLVQAQKLAVGDELLKADGTEDPITRIEQTSHFGKVYNIKPVSTEPVANILIAQGYLVGSSRFQNDDIGYMNRVLLFRGIPDDAMPR